MLVTNLKELSGSGGYAVAETSLSHRLTTLDASFIYFERPNQPLHVGGCMIYEGRLSRDELMQAMAERLHLVPRYRQRLLFPPFNVAHPVWADDPDFDIRNHVEELTLPSPGDDRVLSEVGGRVFAPMMDRNRPLWKLILLHGLADGNTAMIWKVHHAMVDGVSAVDVTMAMHALTPDAAPPPPPPWQPPPLPDPLTLLQDAVRDQLTTAAQQWTDDVFRLLQPAGGDQPVQSFTAGFGDTPWLLAPVPPVPFNGPLSGQRQLVWAELPFAEVRQIKSILGGTVNDLMLALVSGALARYLQRHGYRTEGVVLRAGCPVSMRRATERGTLGNRVTTVIVPLYVGIADPVERLAAERAAMEEVKRQDQAGRLYALSELADRVPPAWLALAGQMPAGDAPQSFIHTMSSNVPGPQVSLYMKGHRLLAMRMFGPLAGNIGLFHAPYSYDHKLTICLMVDPTLMPDAWFYVDCLQESFAEYRDAAARAIGADRLVPTVRPATNGRRAPRRRRQEVRTG